jgi:hypothetical protein
MQVLPEVIASLCRKHAAEVRWKGTPLDLDGKVRLLWGIAGVESSFGVNCQPRHEPGYCYGGKYYKPYSSKVWGCLAHCSYGAWQVMFPNLPEGVSPMSLIWMADGVLASELCLHGAITVLNRAIADGAASLADIVTHYNGPADEESYAARLVDCMDKSMPQEPGVVVT